MDSDTDVQDMCAYGACTWWRHQMENIFRVTGQLCGEFTGPRHKGQILRQFLMPIANWNWEEFKVATQFITAVLLLSVCIALEDTELTFVSLSVVWSK